MRNTSLYKFIECKEYFSNLSFSYFNFVEVTNVAIHQLKFAMFTVLEKLSRFMAKPTEGGDETASSIMGTLQNLVKLLVHCHKRIAVPPDHLCLCMCLVSLPWIAGVVSECSSIVPCVEGWNLGKLKELAYALTSSMNFSICYEGLMAFRPEYFTKWRVYVFKQALVSGRG